MVGARRRNREGGRGRERMTVAEIDALLYLPDHARDHWSARCGSKRFRPDGEHRSRRCCKVKRLRRRGMRGSRLQRRRIRLAPGFRPLSVARSIASPRTSSRCGCGVRAVSRCRRPCQVSMSSCVFEDAPMAGRRFFAAIRSRVRPRRALSNQREDRAEWSCWNISAASISTWATFSTSVRRAEVSFCSRGSGRWCCSALGSARRRFSRCCTRWQRPIRRGRCCGCTPRATGGTTLCCRSPPPHARAAERAQLRLL